MSRKMVGHRSMPNLPMNQNMHSRFEAETIYEDDGIVEFHYIFGKAAWERAPAHMKRMLTHEAKYVPIKGMDELRRCEGCGLVVEAVYDDEGDPDDAILAELLRRLLKTYSSYGRTTMADKRCLLLVDGEIWITEEELAALERTKK